VNRVDVHNLTANGSCQHLRAATWTTKVDLVVVLQSVSGTRCKTNKRL
jgi:hypothetical protein